MPPYATGTPTVAQVDGVPYCTSRLCPAAEGDLWDRPVPPGQDPPAVLYGEAVSAVVEVQPQGIPAHTTYVVLQTDWGDGVWTDVAWLTYTGLALGVFVLSGGVSGANAYQQTRA